MKLLLFATLLIALMSSIEIKADGQDDVQDQPLIYFDKGKIGVNFFGFRAAAGLGKILTGNPADGGLYAEAGTPFGQFAHAGLGGQVDSQGRSTGGLFAGATAGNGVSAKAGLAGSSGPEGSYGTKYAGASTGAFSKTRYQTGAAPVGAFIEAGAAPAPGGIDTIQIVSPKRKEVYVEKKVDALPTYDIDVRPVDLAPAPPIYIEKTKIKGRRRPHLKRKQIFVSHGGYVGFDSLPGPPIAPIAPLPEVPPPPPHGVPAVGVASTKTVTVRKNINPQVVKDALNIPIATLNAVSDLVGGIAKNVDASVTVNKTIVAHKEKY